MPRVVLDSELLVGRLCQVCLLILLGLLISTYSYTGFYASDDFSYLGGARQLLLEGSLPHGFGGNRSGMVLPAAGLLYLTDGSVSLTIYAFTGFHGALIALCYAIGRTAHDHGTGLAAAAITAAFPLAYLFSGSLLPDVPLAAFLAAAFLPLIVLVRRVQETGDVTGARFLALAFLSGTFTGLAYLMKEYAVLFTLPAVIILFSTRPLRSGGAVWLVIAYAAGLATVFGAELLMHWRMAGNWIWRLSPADDPVNVQNVLNNAKEKYGVMPWERLVNLHKAFRGTLGAWDIVFGAAFLIYPFCFRRGWPGQAVATAVFISGFWIWFYLAFGSSSLSEYLPAGLIHRYYIILAPFVIPAAAAVLVLAARHSVRLMGAREKSAVWYSAALVAGAVGYFAVERLAETQSYAGRIYRAGDTTAFLAAYRDATTLEERLPVLLGQYYAGRMIPLFPSGYDHLFNTFHGTEPVERLVAGGAPFYFVAPVAESKQFAPYQFLKTLAAEGKVRMVPAGKGLYAPEPARWQHLSVAMDPLSHADKTHSARWGSGLWRIGPDRAERSAEHRLPKTWAALSEGFRAQNGLLMWKTGSLDAMGEFQLFDSNSDQKAPLAEAAALPEETVSVNVAFSVLTSAEVQVTAWLHGYRDGQLSQTVSEAFSKTDEQIDVRMGLSDVEGIEHYRVRLDVVPKSSTSGWVLPQAFTVSPGFE